jgi:hypothetical protein
MVCVLLIGTSGAGAQETVDLSSQDDATAAVTTTSTTPIFLQPVVSDIRMIARNNSQMPLGQMGITLWGPYEALTFAGTATQLTPFTGLAVQTPLVEHQLVVGRGWPGATGIQTQGRQIGINIHSQSVPQNIASRGGLGTVVVGYNFKVVDRIKPFAKRSNRLRYSFEMKVPRSYYLGDGVTQVVAYFLLLDVVHKQAIWYGFNAFDSRGIHHLYNVGADSVMWDPGTNLPIVHSAFGYGRYFATTDFGSTAFTGYPFAGYHSYSITISGSQLGGAIQSLKTRYPHLVGRLSDNPADYELRHFNFNPEIFVPNQLHFAHIGLTVRNLEINWLH